MMHGIADQVLGALKAAGSKGLLFDEISKQLDIDAKTLETTISKLASEGKITMPIQKLKSEERIRLASQMTDGPERRTSDLNGCPCFHCLKIGKCGIRQPDSPVSCRELEDWMIGAK